VVAAPRWGPTPGPETKGITSDPCRLTLQTPTDLQLLRKGGPGNPADQEQSKRGRMPWVGFALATFLVETVSFHICVRDASRSWHVCQPRPPACGRAPTHSCPPPRGFDASRAPPCPRASCGCGCARCCWRWSTCSASACFTGTSRPQTVSALLGGTRRCAALFQRPVASSLACGCDHARCSSSHQALCPWPPALSTPNATRPSPTPCRRPLTNRRRRPCGTAGGLWACDLPRLRGRPPRGRQPGRHAPLHEPGAAEQQWVRLQERHVVGAARGRLLGRAVPAPAEHVRGGRPMGVPHTGKPPPEKPGRPSNQLKPPPAQVPGLRVLRAHGAAARLPGVQHTRAGAWAASWFASPLFFHAT
jgi:hypothetical protein